MRDHPPSARVRRRPACREPVQPTETIHDRIGIGPLGGRPGETCGTCINRVSEFDVFATDSRRQRFCVRTEASVKPDDFCTEWGAREAAAGTRQPAASSARRPFARH